MENQQKQLKEQSCYHCEGRGYTELRDCAGEIQRTETCSYCEGRGYIVLMPKAIDKNSKNRRYTRSGD